MTSGFLRIENGYLMFYPTVYPSSQLRIYGFSWISKIKAWRADLNRSSLSGVRKEFSNITEDDDIKKWEAEYEKEIVIETNVNSLEFQNEPIAFLLRRKRVLLALAPGLGKTFCSIMAAEKTDARRILVVCPLSLTRNWQKEIKRWCGAESKIWHGHTSTWGKSNKWVISNYDTVIRNNDVIILCDFDLIIIDESILIKNRKAQRTKLMTNIARNTEYVWLLSGSPISKFYDDMYSQLHLLYPRRFSSYWTFSERYCIIERNQWGTAVVGNAAGADREIHKDIDDIYYARTQNQVLNLPEWLFDDVEVEMEKEQQRMYNEMEETFLAELPDDSGEVLALNVLSQLLRLIQFASNPILVGGPNESPKWDAVENMLEYEKLPCIVWTTFKATAHAMEAKLRKKYRVASLTGDTPEKIRQGIVNRFQGEELDAIIAHPGVGKFGFTLTAAHTAIYLERGYSGDDYYQSLHRIRRIGTTESPHVIHLMSTKSDGTKTVDHVISKVLAYRKDSSIKITSGEIRGYFKNGK